MLRYRSMHTRALVMFTFSQHVVGVSVTVPLTVIGQCGWRAYITAVWACLRCQSGGEGGGSVSWLWCCRRGCVPGIIVSNYYAVCMCRTRTVTEAVIHTQSGRDTDSSDHGRIARHRNTGRLARREHTGRGNIHRNHTAKYTRESHRKI